MVNKYNISCENITRGGIRMQTVIICLTGLLIGMVAGQLIRSLWPYGWLIYIGALLCALIVVYGVYFGSAMGMVM